MRGHEWRTCVNRNVCGFIDGEVKAEGHSCSCLEGLIYTNNKRREAQSRAEQKLVVGHSNQSVTICHACESKCAHLLAFDATAELLLFSPFHLHWLPLVTQTQ